MSQSLSLMSVTPPRLPGAHVQLFGRPGHPGILVVQENDAPPVRVHVSKVEFAVLLALAEQALHDLSQPAFMPRGFLNTDQLAGRLREWGPLTLSPHYAVKHVYRARRRIERTRVELGLARDGWAHDFLEWSADLQAYRISVPPEQVLVYRMEL